MSRTARLCQTLCSVLICLTFAGPVAAAPSDDRFIAGYATAVLEREFSLNQCFLSVEGGVITVRGRDLTGRVREKIITALSNIPGVRRVEVSTAPPEEAEVGGVPECAVRERKLFPKGQLFAPLLADPRWPHFSASYLNVLESEEFTDVGAVSFGETFGLYRDRFPMGGQWEIGIQAAVFSIFDLDAESHDLINSDFWVSFPYASYRRGNFSALGRIFHQSSHLGDEYLLRVRDKVNRLNLSYEAVDLLLSYDVYNTIRFYGGGGYLFHREPADLEPWAVQYGLELVSPKSFVDNRIRPVLALYLANREESDWNADLSLRAGIQFESPETITRRYLLMFEYFNGYSPNGQFYKTKLEYLGVGMHIFL